MDKLTCWTVRDNDNVSTPDKVIAYWRIKRDAETNASRLNLMIGSNRYFVRCE
jgi:hypothetical protein